jgi:LmbE family N-acetylglucosaminyl deacetylase
MKTPDDRDPGAPGSEVANLCAWGATAVIAPHPDDAALSLGGTIAQLANVTAAPPTIVTVFAASPEALSPFARAYHDEHGLAGDVVARRRSEELRSAAVLGARVVFLPYVEVLYRDATALDSAFGALASGDHELAAAVAVDLAECEAVRAALTIALPLGIGCHRDHVVTRLAGELAAVRTAPAALVYYEDLPYAARGAPEQWARLVPASASPWLVPLDDAAWARKCEGVACHESQLRILWPRNKTFRSELGSYMDERLAGRRAERVWRPTRAL